MQKKINNAAEGSFEPLVSRREWKDGQVEILKAIKGISKGETPPKNYLQDRSVIFEKFDHMGEKLADIKIRIETTQVKNEERENRTYSKLHEKLRKNREKITQQLGTLTETVNKISVSTRAAGTRRKLINAIIQYTPTLISMIVAIAALVLSFKAMKGV